MTTTALPTDDQIIDADPVIMDGPVTEPEPEPEPVPVEPKATPAKAKRGKAASAEVAKVEESAPEVHKVVLDEGWEHERMEFRGDDLAIRKPKKSAVAGVLLVSSKHVRMDVQNDTIGLFIARHLGPISYGHVMSRMMNPDDDDYTDDTVMTLINQLMNLAGEDEEKDGDAADAKPQ